MVLLRYLDRSIAGWDSAWLWFGDRLVMWARPNGEVAKHDPVTDRYGLGMIVEYDPVTDRITPLAVPPMDWERLILPRIDVSGRPPLSTM